MNSNIKDKKPISLSIGDFFAKAREITGIDCTDEDAVEPFTLLYNNFNQPTIPFNDENVRFVEGYLLRILCNRLRMQRDFTAHPEIKKQIIRAPIFICGMARTGSTKMQKLLASSGDFNWLPYWQSLNPCLYSGDKNESPEERIKDTEKFVDEIHQFSPEVQFTHELAAQEPEEECWLLLHCLRSPWFLGITHLNDYAQWLETFDMMHGQMEFLWDMLKYLQWQGLASPEKRWVLKAPNYFGHEATIKNVFPDASFIMTHRDPKKTLASLFSFIDVIQRPVTHKKGDPSLYVAGIEAQIAQHMALRKSDKALDWCDVNYKELISSVSSVVRKVYEYCSEDLSDASLQRMCEWDKKNVIHAKGKHVYKLEDFGLTETEVDKSFANYMQLTKELFGDEVVAR